MKKLSNQMRREIKRIIAFVLVICMLPFSSFPTNAMSIKPVSEVVETVSNQKKKKRAEEATRVKNQKKTGKHLLSLHRANHNQTERPKRLSAR